MIEINKYIVEKLKLDDDTKLSIDVEDIDDRDSALAYIEAHFKTEPIESWEDNGRAVKIIYNKELSMRIDFINKNEYLFTIYGPNDEEIYDCNSTREADYTKWAEFLDIKKYAFGLKSLRANFGRNKSHIDRMHRLGDKILSLLNGEVYFHK
jgi:capsid portal protein